MNQSGHAAGSVPQDLMHMEEHDNIERLCGGSFKEVGCEPEWITGVS